MTHSPSEVPAQLSAEDNREASGDGARPLAVTHLTLAPGHGLGVVLTMPEFRARAAGKPSLTSAEREILVGQASVLIEGVYVHLPQKRALYAVDPVRRLRLLRDRMAELDDPAFHAELQRVFTELRDGHTRYVPPGLPQRGVAFLGILIERYVEDGESRFMVSKVATHLQGDPHLVPGAEVLHWNGSPIALAVARNAEREDGGNDAARLARGVESLTLRPLIMSPVPDEDWVDLRYRVAGRVHEARIPWWVLEKPRPGDPLPARLLPGEEVGADEIMGLAGLRMPAAVGVDLRTELARDAKRTLFVPEAAGSGRPPPELRYREVQTAHGRFGHLRIFTFTLAVKRGPGESEDDATNRTIMGFLAAVMSLLPRVPREGLIVDVRGNPGGFIAAAEALLQYFTPRPVAPAPAQVIGTPLIRALCAWATSVPDAPDAPPFAALMRPYAASVAESSGAEPGYSAAIPFTPAAAANLIGQRYHGPVVLITDGLCYSATDILAGGFQDHEVGDHLGVDPSTGAGGASVVEHRRFPREDWPDGPFRALPGDARMRVALERSLRVGPNSGVIVEDVGVRPEPDRVHATTRRDLLEGNGDLMERAAELLAARTPRTLGLDVTRGPGNTATLDVITGALTRIDVHVHRLRYVDGVPTTVEADAHDPPVATRPVADGLHTLTVPAPGAGLIRVRVEGFSGDDLVAAHSRILR